MTKKGTGSIRYFGFVILNYLYGSISLKTRKNRGNFNINLDLSIQYA